MRYAAVVAPGGPLNEPPAHGWATTEPVGATFTDGLEVLYLNGHEDAVITSVSLIGGKGLKLLGARLVTPDRQRASAQKLAWPPRSAQMPHIVDGSCPFPDDAAS